MPGTVLVFQGRFFGLPRARMVDSTLKLTEHHKKTKLKLPILTSTPATFSCPEREAAELALPELVKRSVIAACACVKKVRFAAKAVGWIYSLTAQFGGIRGHCLEVKEKNMTRGLRSLPVGVAFLCIVFGPIFALGQSPSKSEVVRESDDFLPAQEKLPVVASEDAIQLFDGKTINCFRSKHGEEIDWPVEHGALVSTKGNVRSNHIVSLLHFRDAEIHVEFMLPEKGNGNSGVYIHGNYELQIFNSHQKKKVDQQDMGAIYGVAAPLVNAARPPGVWQVYDIKYLAPRRDSAGKIIEKGLVTAWLNGKKVQDRTRFGEPKSAYHPYRYKATPYLKKIWETQTTTMTGPVFLQDHDSPVRFRNVWIRPLDDLAKHYKAKVK